MRKIKLTPGLAILYLPSVFVERSSILLIIGIIKTFLFSW